MRVYSLDAGGIADKVEITTYVYGGREGRTIAMERRSSREVSAFFCGRVAAMSGAGESPRERLSGGTGHPDSDEHNTRGAG